MFELENCVAFVTNKASKILSDALNSELIKYGITKSQWIAMYYINSNEKLNQKDLSKLMNTKEPTTAGILDRIENDGLIERTKDTKDKRNKLLKLTEKGTKLNSEMIEIAKNFRDNCLDGISEKDQDVFMRVLDQMIFSASQWKYE